MRALRYARVRHSSSRTTGKVVKQRGDAATARRHATAAQHAHHAVSCRHAPATCSRSVRCVGRPRRTYMVGRRRQYRLEEGSIEYSRRRKATKRAWCDKRSGEARGGGVTGEVSPRGALPRINAALACFSEVPPPSFKPQTAFLQKGNARR